MQDRWNDPWDDYQSDPVFMRLVDMMYALILQADYTPSEVRRAAMMACIKIEMYRPAPKIFMRAQDLTIAERGKQMTKQSA